MLKSIKINDNITLFHIPMEKLKTTSLSMFIHRPLAKNEASKNAILPHILKNGCRMCKNPTEIAHYLENLYGARFSSGISKRGEDHILCFEAETISDKYAAGGEKLTLKTLELILSVVFDTLDEFSDNTFSVERTNSINKIKNIINDKRIYANYRCQEEMCRGENFEIPRLGYVEDLEKLTKEELYDYYKMLRSESVIDIYVCGEADVSELADLIREKTSGIDFIAARMPECDIIKRERPINTVTERLDVTQGKLSMGFLTDTKLTDDDYFALVVANAIYGGGAQSKLFNNVREKLSLCYYAGSVLDKYKGFLMVNAGIEFENYKKAYDEILVQLDEMKKGNISDLEFESSKGFLINSLSSYDDDQAAMISFYLGEKVSGTNADIDYYKANIEKVTREDVVKAVNKVHLDTVYFLEGLEG